MTLRALATTALATALAGCATTADLAPAPAEDCAVLMLVGGFIADHQPPLRLRPVTADLRLAPDEPERWSPDAGLETIAAIGQARQDRRRPPHRIACPLTGPSPFVAWRPGRAELVLSNPAYAPAGDFAVVDAQVLLPGRRADHYRFILSGPPRTGWDIHRIEFETRPLR